MKKLFAIIIVFAFAVMITSCGRKTPVKLTKPDTNLQKQKDNDTKEK